MNAVQEKLQEEIGERVRLDVINSIHSTATSLRTYLPNNINSLRKMHRLILNGIWEVVGLEIKRSLE